MRNPPRGPQAEKALLESQALYQSLVEHIPQMIFRKDLDGRFTFASPHFCESWHKSVEEVVGKTDFDFYSRTLAEKYQRDDAETASAETRILETVDREAAESILDELGKLLSDDDDEMPGPTDASGDTGTGR